MNRRSFLSDTVVYSSLFGLNWKLPLSKTHLLTFSFDDGFKKSFYRAAEIHEEYGLSACFNVIATGHFKSFRAIDDWILPELLGDFNDWNKLKAKGHELMPHTWEHLNLTKVPLQKAKDNIDKCLEYFEENLDDFKVKEAVFNYAFLASTPEIEKYTLTKVAASRTGAWLCLDDTRVNEVPSAHSAIQLGAWANGPGYCDDFLDREIETFLKGKGGWLILNLHGFDNEGWGPVRTSYFDKLLKRLVKVEYLDILPTGMALKKYGGV